MVGPARTTNPFDDQCPRCGALPIRGNHTDHCWHCGRSLPRIAHAIPTPAPAEDTKGAA